MKKMTQNSPTSILANTLILIDLYIYIYIIYKTIFI